MWISVQVEISVGFADPVKVADFPNTVIVDFPNTVIDLRLWIFFVISYGFWILFLSLWILLIGLWVVVHITTEESREVTNHD